MLCRGRFCMSWSTSVAARIAILFLNGSLVFVTKPAPTGCSITKMNRTRRQVTENPYKGETDALDNC